MNILVCVKQVPDMDGTFVPNSAGTWFEESGHAWRMNEYDACAVEQALRLRENVASDVTVTVLSIGPGRVVDTIRKALAMGCDEGVHIDDSQAPERDPWQIAMMIAAYAVSRKFDLVFTGMQSEDRSSAQVGVMVAERLGYSCVTGIMSFEWQDRRIVVDRELEGGRRGRVALSAPALLTCQLGLNAPRYPTLPNIMKSKRASLTVLHPDDVCVEAPKTSFSGVRLHERKTGGVVLEGDATLLARQVLSLVETRRCSFRQGGAR
jgi:electron transfer flavoprotein beta subunit